jgi:hypothetical protein
MQVFSFWDSADEELVRHAVGALLAPHSVPMSDLPSPMPAAMFWGESDLGEKRPEVIH